MDTMENNVKKKIKDELFLPDEIVRNILIRLPAKSAMRFRLVCRKWRDFTSARDFVDLHLKNSIPTILVANPKYYCGLDLFALDEWWEFSRTKFVTHGFPLHSEKFASNSRALFSHAGLIVLKAIYGSSLNNFVILNPASHEHVRITLSDGIQWGSTIYGVYYHPLLKEYCSLFKIGALGATRMEYKILNLGSNSSFRTISNPFGNRVEKRHANPLLINNYIYWLLKSEQGYYKGYNDIMEFDIIREEFMILHCPVPLDIKCEEHETCLVNIDGILAFLLFQPTNITIWRLEDREEFLWTVAEYPLSVENFSGVDKGIAVVGGKLALMLKRRIIVCNLMNGSVKNISKGKYGDDVSFLSHQMSLASLKNCKSKIIIDKNGVVVDMRKKKRKD